MVCLSFSCKAALVNLWERSSLSIYWFAGPKYRRSFIMEMPPTIPAYIWTVEIRVDHLVGYGFAQFLNPQFWRNFVTDVNCPFIVGGIIRRRAHSLIPFYGESLYQFCFHPSVHYWAEMSFFKLPEYLLQDIWMAICFCREPNVHLRPNAWTQTGHFGKRDSRRKNEKRNNWAWTIGLTDSGTRWAMLIIVQVWILFHNSHSFRHLHFTLHKSPNCPSNKQFTCANCSSAPYLKQHAI